MQFPWITERKQLQAIFDIYDSHVEEHQVSPEFVSHWDPDSNALASIKELIELPCIEELVAYQFSDESTFEKPILSKLGYDPEEYNCIITPSGTSSILNAVIFLSNTSVRSLNLLHPTYFPVIYDLSKLKIDTHEYDMNREEDAYRIPDDFIASCRECAWISSPVYGTGQYYKESDVLRLINKLDNENLLVVDESLAWFGMEVSPKIAIQSKKVIGIHTPHKGICVNSMKFSCIAFPREYTEHFFHWSDVLCGGLSASNIAACRHFLSPNFLKIQIFIKARVEKSKKWLQNICEDVENVSLDNDTWGHFVSLYFPELPVELGDDINFVRELCWETGCLVIPGKRNHLNNAGGFSFRVNLMRRSSAFEGALARAIEYLSKIKV